MTYFGQVKSYVGQVKNHAKLVLKLMLVPTLAKNLAKNNDNDILDFVKIHR